MNLFQSSVLVFQTQHGDSEGQQTIRMALHRQIGKLNDEHQRRLRGQNHGELSMTNLMA